MKAKLPVPEGLSSALADFRNFLWLAWRTLNLPDPTRLQYDVANWIQNPEIDRIVILAFRGFGKSWITSMFGCWRLLLDCQRKFLNTSASSGKADQATRFMLSMIKLMPELQHLEPGLDQRSSNIEFDVAGSLPAHAPSVLSLGINSNLMQGSRCDDFCADDVESQKNSQTMTMRQRIEEVCRELGGAILRSSDEVIDPKGIYLGTPQVEESLYFKLEEKGYRVLIYPARYPDEATNKIYAGRLAPILQQELDANPNLVGKPTEPKRFGEEVLLKRKAEYGKRGWLLQFMLMPHLATQDRYPLKISDCVVMDLDPEMGPEKVIWENNSDNRINDLPCVGFSRDYWHRPAAVVGRYIPYDRSVMAIDPSAEGEDECAYSVLKCINSQIFLMDTGGFRHGNSEETFRELAEIAKKWSIKKVVVEKNYGGGMWTQLFKPFLRQYNPDGVSVEEVNVQGRKELRNIAVLDPVMDSHRLIVNRSAIENDYNSTQEYKDGTLTFQLFHQVSRLTADVDCLEHDDRLDSLSLGVAHFETSMARTFEDEIERRKQDKLDEQLEAWNNGIMEFGTGMVTGKEARKTWLSRNR